MRNGNIRRFQWGLALMSLLLMPVFIGACAKSDDATAQEDGEAAEATFEVPRNVRTLTLSPNNVEEFFALSGPLRPLSGTDLSAEENGRIERILSDKGARVEKGDILLMQDRALLEAEMQAAAAASDLSAFNYERMQRLHQENAVSEIELLEAESTHRQSEAMASAARIRFERAALKAPFSGIVSNRYVEVGQLVAAGTPAMRIVNPYTLKLVGSVTERDIMWVSEGKQAWLEFEGVNGIVRGTVHWVGLEADPQTGKFPVELRIDNSDLRVHPGVIGRASVLKTIHERVISIPRDAILQQAGRPEAFIVEDGRARKRSLRLGSDQGLMVIVEAGLDIGDKLIVRGQREVTDGASVLIQEEADAADGSMSGDPSLGRGVEVGR